MTGPAFREALTRWILPWTLFFVLLFACATQAGLNVGKSWADFRLAFWSTSAAEAVELLLPADAARYIEYAEQIIGQPGFFKTNWMFRTWPPGLPLVIATVLATTGSEHYIAKMAVISAAVWATALVITLNGLPFARRRGVRFLVLALMPLVLPDLRVWMVGRGILMTESISMALFVIVLVSFSRALRGTANAPYYLASSLLGVAAVFRLNFDWLGRMLHLGFLVLVLGAACWLFLLRRARNVTTPGRRRRPPLLPTGPRRPLKLALVGLLAFYAVTFPVRLYHRIADGVFMMAGSSASELTVWYQFQRTEDLPHFVHAGNTACVVDPEFCEVVTDLRPELSRRKLGWLVLTSFLHSPDRWIGHRLRNINWYWVGLPWRIGNVRELHRFAEGVLYLAALGLAVGMLVRAYRRRRFSWGWNPVTAFVVLSLLFLAFHLGSILFVHFEHRYSLPLRIYCLVAPALVLNLPLSSATVGSASRKRAR